MSDEKKPEAPARPKIQIKVDEATANGVYSNMVILHSNDSEFTLDFCFVQPHQPFASVRSRVVTSPRHVKRLLRILSDQMERWERRHGEIGPLESGGAEGAYH